MIEVSVIILILGAVAIAAGFGAIAYGAYKLGGERAAKRCADEARALGGHLDLLRENARQLGDALMAKVAEKKGGVHPAELSNDHLWGRAAAPADTDIIKQYGRDFRVICVANFKGGVGKTTVAANLGAFLAAPYGDRTLQRKRVLFIDTDFQGSLSSMLRPKGAAPQSRAAMIFSPPDRYTDDEVFAAIQPASIQGLGQMHYLDADLALEDHQDLLRYEFVLGLTKDDARFRLARRLLVDKFRDSFDVVVIDTPPRRTLLTLNALSAATHIFVPTKLDVFSQRGVSTILKEIASRRAHLWPHAEVAGIIATMTTQARAFTATERSRLRSIRQDLAEATFGDVDVLEPNFRQRTGVANPGTDQPFALYTNAVQGQSIRSEVAEVCRAAALRLFS
ncbi:MAG: ParA family protein [Pseudomonadota bacterium]